MGNKKSQTGPAEPNSPDGNPGFTAGDAEAKRDSSARPFSVTDDFDLKKLRARSGPSAASSSSGSDTVRLEKPNKMRFVFVHPTWREELYIIPADEKRKPYLVVADVAEQFPQFCRAALIVPYASQHNNWFLWPILLEDRTGRISDFSESAIQRVHEANGRWARFEANLDNRSYELYVAAEQREPPKWPSGGIEYLIRRAFEDRIITNIQHLVIRQLLGNTI
jgi:hypothetical protein